MYVLLENATKMLSVLSYMNIGRSESPGFGESAYSVERSSLSGSSCPVVSDTVDRTIASGVTSIYNTFPALSTALCYVGFDTLYRSRGEKTT
jgi:hypothetical protein